MSGLRWRRQDPDRLAQHTDGMLREGRSVTWGGLGFALPVGLIGLLVGWLTGHDGLAWGFRCAAITYALVAVLTLPAWLISRRAGRPSAISEPLGVVAVTFALLWVAFFR